MVAFVLSSVIGLALFGGILRYGARRGTDAALTWGEAMAGATLAFFLLFWFYGVIPHQWLTWADNELGWRSDKLFLGPGEILKPQEAGGWLPLTITYVVIRDLIAVGIYVVGLALQIFAWAWWNDRKKPKEAVVPASRYGRPLVRT